MLASRLREDEQIPTPPHRFRLLKALALEVFLSALALAYIVGPNLAVSPERTRFSAARCSASARARRLRCLLKFTIAIATLTNRCKLSSAYCWLAVKVAVETGAVEASK